MTDQDARTQNSIRLAKRLGLIAVGMFVFAVGILPPMYDVICDITGLNGKTSNEADSADAAVVQEDRLITVQFLADTDPEMPWDFRPVERSIQVHPGEIRKVDFHVRNREPNWIVGQAIPSLTPSQATPYFKKTECFCFNQQELQGGDAKDMPLIFYIDPNLPKSVTTITLSYTLFNITDKVQKESQRVAAATQ